MNLSKLTKKQLIAHIHSLETQIQGSQKTGIPLKDNFRIEELFFNFREGILVCSSQHEILYANRSFCDILKTKKSAQSFIGKSIFEVLNSLENLVENYKQFYPSLEKALLEYDSVYNREIGFIDGRIIKLDSFLLTRKNKKSEYAICFRDITESRKAELDLLETKERLELGLAVANQGMWDWDLTTSVVYFDPRYYTMAGYKVNEFPYTLESFQERVHSEDIDRVMDTANKHLKGEIDCFEVEFRFLKKDRSWMWILGRARIMERDKDGSPTRFIGTHTEITERKEAEEALAKSEALYHDLVETSQDLIWQCDADSRYTFLNTAWEEVFGYEIGQMLGKKFSEFQYPEQAARDEVEFSKLMKGGILKKFETVHLGKNGNEIHLVFNAKFIRDKTGKIIGTRGTAYDITERKNAENALRESESKYRHLIQHSGEAIYLLYNRRFELINYKFEELFGVSLKKANRKDFDFINLVAPKSRPKIEERIKRQKNDKKLEPSYEFTAINSKGEEIEVEATVTYVKYKNSFATQGILRDITEQKRIERQLRQAQKMEAVGQLAGGIAHDFNNLLTVINGYCEILSMNDLSPKIADSLNQIQKAGNRATQLTSQLLAFSRKQIIQPQVLNLNSVISNYLKMLGRLLGENIDISTKLFPELEQVKADPGQIEQIIMNIAINSRDAMPFGGQLIIETNNVKIDKSCIKNYQGAKTGPYVQLLISDSGRGMDSKTLAHIFEPFFTTKGRDKGTGLGLATVYGIVKQNNGFIDVKSRLHKGTSIKIFLPRIKQDQIESEGKSLNQKDLKGTETILLVEDDPGVRKVTRSTLVNYGYSVLSASDGKQALKIFDSYHSSIDLVLTDVVMPNMNGREIVEIIVNKNPRIKVLYFSGYTDDNIAHHGVLEDGVEFIQKPYSQIDLVSKIKKILHHTN